MGKRTIHDTYHVSNECVDKLNIGFIYFLIDPRTEDIRYIGRTKNLCARYRSHLVWYACYTDKRWWIKELLDKGLKPKLRVYRVVDQDKIEEVETQTILHFIKQGYGLFNRAKTGKYNKCRDY